MRRLQSDADIKRIQKRNNTILGVVMIIILASSTLGFSFLGGGGTQSGGTNNPSGSSLEENGYEFYYVDAQWRVEVNSQVYSFTYLPSEVEDVPVQGSHTISRYTSKVLYVVNSGDGTTEILNNLGRYTSRYQEACIDGMECEGDFPIKGCSDPLIIFEDSEDNETKVSQDSSCVYISGDPVKGADAFLYKLLNINPL